MALGTLAVSQYLYWLIYLERRWNCTVSGLEKFILLSPSHFLRDYWELLLFQEWRVIPSIRNFAYSFIIIIISCLTSFSAWCYCRHFFCLASNKKWAKANRMISSLHLQHFSQYLCSSQQCSLLHHSNIVILSFLIHPSNSFVTLPRAPITTSRTSTILSFRISQSHILSPSFFFS